MSKPLPPTTAAPKTAKRAPRDDEPATQLSIPVGPQVLEILGVAYRARRPVLLEGLTGIGKSQIVGEFAAMSGIRMVGEQARGVDAVGENLLSW
jgi:MoxR-like ATPase